MKTQRDHSAAVELFLFCQNVHGLLCLQLQHEDRLKAESGGVIRKGNPLQGPRVGSHVLTKQETWLEGHPGGQQQGNSRRTRKKQNTTCGGQTALGTQAKRQEAQIKT
ncbi:hypothetical protein AB1E18_002849 [Capra hircus]